MDASSAACLRSRKYKNYPEVNKKQNKCASGAPQFHALNGE